MTMKMFNDLLKNQKKLEQTTDDAFVELSESEYRVDELEVTPEVPVVRALNGSACPGNIRFGRHAQNLTITVPVDTEIRNVDTVIAKGGVGGKGLTGKRWQDRKWNSEAEKERAKSWITGQRGECIKAFVELKRIADVGFIGFPNAGKSTLLKALSKANPQISAAPFTTIRPNIGVIKFDDGRRIELADLPGLIDGAHSGRGYGHQFLHMIERNSCHLMVVDINGFQLDANAPFRTAFETIVQLVSELGLYNEHISSKPFNLVLTKADIPDSNRKYEILMDQLDNWDKMIDKLKSKNEQVPSSKPRFESVHFISPRLELRNKKRETDSEELFYLKKTIRKLINKSRLYEAAKISIKKEENDFEERKRSPTSKDYLKERQNRIRTLQQSTRPIDQDLLPPEKTDFDF
ncbi:unnamed protein product [Oikopleura dioica]|uniref:GTP-binding protein 10 n=1 Tax=Oikopleura dioica TaxID=34765 RepID=E4XMJ6_OIKDI|nr:unnamed protein product [Oikopleura dioica]